MLQHDNNLVHNSQNYAKKFFVIKITNLRIIKTTATSGGGGGLSLQTQEEKIAHI